MNMTATLLGLGLLSGLMIGCVGIGGVILVPVMTLGIGIPIGTAIAAAMAGYVLTGITGTLVFGRNGSIRWPLALSLCLGAAPGALLGAWASAAINAHVIEILIAALAIASGLYNLRDKRLAGGSPVPLNTISFVAIGACVGLLSAVTGTGGPVILVPLMLTFGYPVLTAVGLGQAIQLPVATLATFGAYTFGSLDIYLSVLLSLGLAVGSTVGAGVAHHVPRATLRTIAASVLIATGAFIIYRLVI
ncbi:sulfite exporter TauE/SafE family protein [Methylobacterium nigriterrae]|uniref:sulfite exporter TauE/SafE family protein n=1 Tax=Methylobacterium nigriterrae TaxID=3127512 RepID=UPI0030139AF8